MKKYKVGLKRVINEAKKDKITGSGKKKTQKQANMHTNEGKGNSKSNK